MSSDSERHAREAQQAAELHLEACFAHFLDDAPEPEGLLAPFCGCTTCQIRETLNAAEPHLRAMWENE